MEAKVYNMTAKEVGTVTLNDSVFGAEYNESLIHQVVVAQLANKRQGTKSTLTRAEVRGGGIKPWRQKGTGRARQGSIRAPQWTGGGVVFAPKPRDFSQKINKKAKDEALRSALSAKLADNELVIVDDIKFGGKTKEAVQMLKAFDLSDKRVYIVTDNNDEMTLRATGNIQKLTLASAELINVYDLVASGKCVMTKGAVKKIEEAYAL